MSDASTATPSVDLPGLAMELVLTVAALRVSTGFLRAVDRPR